MAGKPAELSDQERRFVDEYLVDFNGVQAYLRSYGKSSYHVAGTLAARLLKKVAIKREIAAYQYDYAKRCRVRADKVIKETANVAFFDPIDLFDDDGELRPMRHIPVRSRKAIASVKVKKTPRWELEDGEKVKLPDEVVTEYRFHPKMVALDKLIAHLGLAQSITPMEAFLAALDNIDPVLAGQVRTRLAASVPAEGNPKSSGDPPSE